MCEELRDALFDSKARPLRVQNWFTKLTLNVSDFKPFSGPGLVYCTSYSGKQYRYELDEFLEVFVIVEETEMKQDLQGMRAGPLYTHGSSKTQRTKGFHVINLKGDMPTVTHETAELALMEAERLAVNNPGQEFTVVQRVKTYKAKQAIKVESY